MGLRTEPIESSIPPGEPARRRFRVASAGSDRTHICPTVRGRLVQSAGSVGWFSGLGLVSAIATDSLMQTNSRRVYLDRLW